MADALAAGRGTAALLARSLVRDLLAREQAADQVQESIGGEVVSDLHEALRGTPVDPLPPERAVEYFRSLVPSLGVDPQRFGELQRRQAFTLAASIDTALISRVQQVIGDYLEYGTHRPAAGQLGSRIVRYVAHPHAGPEERLILVDPRKLDTDWQRDTSYHLPTDAKGASEIRGRRENFEKFLATGDAVEAPRVLLGADGLPSFLDGRHRFAVLRDRDVSHVGIMVPADQATAFQARYGAATPSPAKPFSVRKAVDEVLARAGVSPANPAYAETVVRTNLLDSFNSAADEARMDPDVIDWFPVWEYSAIMDGRARPEHAARNGRYYPANVTFVSVRGTDIKDAANCRCTSIPVSKRQWARLRAAGARIADGYPDVLAA